VKVDPVPCTLSTSIDPPSNFDNLSQKISDFCDRNNIKNIEIDLNQTNYYIFNILQKQINYINIKIH